jgi:hypothetical protein
VSQFLCSEGVKTIEIDGRMAVQHDDNCVSKRKIYEWVERFKGRRTSDDNGPSDRSQNVTCTEIKEDIYQCIRQTEELVLVILRVK